MHVDAKSNSTYELLKDYARCVPNVHILEDRQDVTYAAYSRLEADFLCMKKLLAMGDKWKYLINLCGQDFPIQSNKELVEDLKLRNGSRDGFETSCPCFWWC